MGSQWGRRLSPVTNPAMGETIAHVPLSSQTGVVGQDGNVVRFQPPLAITRDQLAHVVEVLDGALESVQVPA